MITDTSLTSFVECRVTWKDLYPGLFLQGGSGELVLFFTIFKPVEDVLTWWRTFRQGDLLVKGFSSNWIRFQNVLSNGIICLQILLKACVDQMHLGYQNQGIHLTSEFTSVLQGFTGGSPFLLKSWLMTLRPYLHEVRYCSPQPHMPGSAFRTLDVLSDFNLISNEVGV